MHRSSMSDFKALDESMMDEAVAALKDGAPSPYWYCGWSKERSDLFDTTLRSVLDETTSAREAAGMLVDDDDARAEWRAVFQDRTRSELVRFLGNRMSGPFRFPWADHDPRTVEKIEALAHAMYFAMCDVLLIDSLGRSSWQAIYSSYAARAWRESAASRVPYRGSVNAASRRAVALERQASSWVPDNKVALDLAASVLGDFVPCPAMGHMSTDEGVAAARRVEDLMTDLRVMSLALAGTTNLEGSFGDSGNGQPFAVRMLNTAYSYAQLMLLGAIDRDGTPAKE